MVCEIHPAQADRYTYDGTGGAPVHATTASSYDGLGRLASQTRYAQTSVADATGHLGPATLSGGVTEGVAGLVAGDTDAALSLAGSTRPVPPGPPGIDTAA